MNRQRSRAYAHVMKTLADVGRAKLLPSEQARIRNAADTLLFCDDVITSRPARAALADLDALRTDLVACGRWSAVRAGRLLDDVWACAPDVPLPVAV
jgi:hypothetical protein